MGLLILLAACNNAAVETEETPVALEVTPTATPSLRGRGNTLRLLYAQAPTILNPHLSLASKDFDPSRVTYEPLASVAKDGNLIPFLAAEIPSLENGGLAADGKSVTWQLKRGVQWSDGEPFTAEDVRFTYEFITNPEVGATSAATYGAIDSIEIIDDYTVKLNFRDVNPAWVLPFTGIQGMILPEHIFKDYNGANVQDAPANTMPVGTGPYRVVSFKPQEVLFVGNDLIETNKIVFEPNPYFREEDKPYFSKIELRGGGIASYAAKAVLEDGTVDFAPNLQVLDAETRTELQEGQTGQFVPNPVPFVERILLNHTDPNRQTADGERSSLDYPHPFLSELAVRQALSYAIDREAIAALYLGGSPTSNVLVSPASYASPNTSYQYDLAKAADLLDQAGWVDSDGDGTRDKDGVEMKVVFQTTVDPIRQQTQALVKESLGAIGVEVEIKIVDASAFFDNQSPNGIYRFHTDMQEFNDGNLSPDPGPYMQFWTCDQIPQKANDWTGENVIRWCNPTYDDLYERSTTEIDEDQRRQLFIQMNDILVEEVTMIPLVHLAFIAGVSNSLEGVELTPRDADLWNIKDWRRATP